MICRTSCFCRSTTKHRINDGQNDYPESTSQWQPVARRQMGQGAWIKSNVYQLLTVYYLVDIRKYAIDHGHYPPLAIIAVLYFQDWHPVSESTRIRFSRETNVVSMTITDTIARDTGVYSCIATNAAGRASTSCTLTVMRELMPLFRLPT